MRFILLLVLLSWGSSSAWFLLHHRLLLLDQWVAKIVSSPLLLSTSFAQSLLRSPHHLLLLCLSLLLVPRLVHRAPLPNNPLRVLPPLLLLLLGQAGQVQTLLLRPAIPGLPNSCGNVGYLGVLRHEESVEDQLFPCSYRDQICYVTKAPLVHDDSLQGKVGMAFLFRPSDIQVKLEHTHPRLRM